MVVINIVDDNTKQIFESHFFPLFYSTEMDNEKGGILAFFDIFNKFQKLEKKTVVENIFTDIFFFTYTL